jgi:hypothetical protein
MKENISHTISIYINDLLIYIYIKLYSSPNVTRMIKSRRIRWSSHAAYMADKRNTYRILVESQKERDN